MKTLVRCVLAICILSLVACGDEKKATKYIISGTITYTGTATGRMFVTVGTKEVPTCPNDMPVAYQMVPTATFPYDYSLEVEGAGTYYAAVLFDVNSDAGTIPCPKADDICGKSLAVVLTKDEPKATQDITLDIIGCTL